MSASVAPGKRNAGIRSEIGFPKLLSTLLRVLEGTDTLYEIAHRTAAIETAVERI